MAPRKDLETEWAYYHEVQGIKLICIRHQIHFLGSDGIRITVVGSAEYRKPAKGSLPVLILIRCNNQ